MAIDMDNIHVQLFKLKERGGGGGREGGRGYKEGGIKG